MDQSSMQVSVIEHTKRAGIDYKDWLVGMLALRKNKVRKTALQVGVSAVFGLFLLIWAEVTLFLALHSAVAAPWAALLTVVFNGLVIGGINLIVKRWKQADPHAEQARASKDEGTLELRAAGDQLAQLRHELTRNASEFVEARVFVPYRKYKMPAAIAATFVTGVVVARALFPPRQAGMQELIR